MTGPVERVPLTDEQLDEIAERAEWPAGKDWAQRALQDRDDLFAELRASRARGQELVETDRELRQQVISWIADYGALEAKRDELQQRIDKALEVCGTREVHAFMSGQYYVQSRLIRAALTGTET